MSLSLLILFVCSSFLHFDFASNEQYEIQDEIRNGEDISWEKAPYMVMLRTQKGKVGRCSGAIYKKKPGIILTAAHCFKTNTKPEDITVFIGCSTTKCAGSWFTFMHEMAVEDFVIHRDYKIDNSNLAHYDIAVVKLKNPITYKGTKELKIYNKNKESLENNQEVIVIGYGKSYDLQPPADEKHLKKGETNYFIQNNKCCGKALPKHDICLKSQSQVVPLKGDSGGPAIIRKRWMLFWTKLYQIGIISYGLRNECGVVYVPDFKDWIEGVVKNFNRNNYYNYYKSKLFYFSASNAKYYMTFLVLLVLFICIMIINKQNNKKLYDHIIDNNNERTQLISR